MIDVQYNEQMLRKARALRAEADKLPPDDRENYLKDKCGLSYSYIRRIGKQFKQPSARTLMNMGYELLIRDLATGEMSLLELDVACDWNPRNPRMNPVSTPIYVTELSEPSSSSE